MLSLVIILLSRFNASRVTREEEDFYPDVTFYGPITSAWDVSASSGDSDDSDYPCYYLDYSGSLTLILDNIEYKNPLLFCPGDASDIEFLPASREVYYARVFNLNDQGFFMLNPGATSIHIATKAASFKSPDVISDDDSYYSTVLAPIPGGTVIFKSSGDYFAQECETALCFLSDNTKKSVSVTVKAGSGGYTFQKKLYKKYSIEFPSSPPYVFTDESGLSMVAIVGISVSAVVVLGSAVGASVFIILRRRKSERDSERETESES